MMKRLLWCVLGIGLAACGDASPDAGLDGSVDAAVDAAVDPVLDAGTADAGSPEDGLRTITIDTGEFVFDARTTGPDDGEFVLLLHGFPETSYEWRAQLLALGEAGYRAVAPNQRGYSATARPAAVEDYALPQLVADVGAFADALGASEFHLVGHDWGAVVAWAAGVAYPDRIQTLTTVSIPHPDAFAAELSDMSSCQYMASSYFDFFIMEGAASTLLNAGGAGLRGFYTGLSPEAVDDYLAVLGTEEALGAALNWYRANIEERNLVGPALGPVTVPTLFIWSDMDSASCREGAEATADYVSGPYEFEVITGVSHWVPELAPDEVNAALLRQLGR